MAAWAILLHSALFFSNALVVEANQEWESSVNEQGKSVQTMQIQAPSMTEEDQYGYNMPDRYRCDSCRAVVFHLNDALTRKQLKSRRLQEWETEEIFQETCKSAFKGYGIKLVGGENVLSGPGLKAQEELQPGMGAIQMGGEGWEKRLSEICRKLVYDKIGEDELYEIFSSTNTLSEDLCFEKSRDCQKPSFGPKEVQKPNAAQPAQSEKKGQQLETKKKHKDVRGKKKGALSIDEPLDLRSFVKKLAVEHGHPVSDYTGKHDRKHWERVLALAATWVSNTPTTLNGNVMEI